MFQLSTELYRNPWPCIFERVVEIFFIEHFLVESPNKAYMKLSLLEESKKCRALFFKKQTQYE